MADIESEVQISLVECDICLKEIPVSAAKHDETSDYVLYFCGIDCYDKWKKQDDQPDQSEK